MKKLTRVKLINWHRFVNPDPITIKDTTLLSGENGSGKTTFLDAIQYVLLASANSFNSAAHTNGKRKVTTYVRSKTGKENGAYERKGSVSAHIALEFYEESTDSYFVIGAVIDSLSEGQEQTIRYLMDNTTLEDISFINKNTPRSIKQFRAANSIESKKWYRTQREARAAIANRLGRLESRFFDLIPKAVAFKPIDDIKDFVYTYVLDEKKMDIEELQDNVHNYRELEGILNRAKKRLNELEEINEAYQKVNEFIQREKKYNYFIDQAQLDLLQSQLESLKKRIDFLTEKINDNQQYKLELEKAQNENSRLISDLKAEMSSNEEFRALENQKYTLTSLQTEFDSYKPTIKEIERKTKQSLKSVQNLLKNHFSQPILSEYKAYFTNVLEIEDITKAQEILSEVIAYKKEEHIALNQEIFGLDSILNEKSQELDELNKEIELLKYNQRSYPKNTVTLFDGIKHNFESNNFESEPSILCEVLEIKDEEWRNAVEGYLNTQRFYVLVDPEHYDYALSVYDYLRSKKKAYGVGLINAAKMADYDVAPPDTLASVVTSKNLFARRYINQVLGKVHLCESKDELKKYPAAITKECMKYQNRVATAIKPEIFETPWIGQQSYRIQLEKAQAKKKVLEKELKTLQKDIKSKKALLSLLNYDDENYLKYNLEVIRNYKSVQERIKQCRLLIAKLEKNQTILLKKKQLTDLEEKQKTLEQQRDKIISDGGRLKEQREISAIALENNEDKLPQVQEKAEKAQEEAGSSLPAWQKEYRSNIKDKELDTFIDNYKVTIKRNETQLSVAEKTMSELMTEYKYAHDFGAPATIDGYPQFKEAYVKLKSSEILEYEDQVQRARENAEIEFKEQFLSKLQENIKEAQGEFKRLNSALKGITFSSEHYKFVCRPGREKRAFYDMIMDPNNVGVSIFSGSFYEKHKEEIRELFDQLTQEDEGQEVKTFTDYRNYLDFDIEITHDDGSVSMYSKVCEEKSGGETQTPFYVAIAASFVQLYSNSISGEATGIIMFDEAFNNMDDERITGVLEFINQLPLQVIIAAPPDKIQYIAPQADQTILVTMAGNRNYISEYSYDRPKSIEAEYEIDPEDDGESDEYEDIAS